MSNDSCLDSFFSEINEIDERVAAASDETQASAVNANAGKPSMVASQTKVVIASRPQVAVSSSSIDHGSKKELSVYEMAELYNKQIDEMNSSKKDITVADTLPAASDVAMRNDKKFVRSGGGSVWVDETLCEWPENDYRLFIGDISKEVTDEAVAKHFKALYKSFVKARVVHSKKESKGRGYAFVSFLDPLECAKALREQNGKYLCNRPMRISRADWKTHDIKEVRKKEQQKRKFGLI